ncbi:MAG: glycosyltransferase [Thermodesulfobacteriota bacterium]|nr:glycosyltransferase [Thermodesulfobacteriota bacterium]
MDHEFEQIFRQHRINGYSEPGSAEEMGRRVLAGPGGAGARQKRLLLGTSLLRQSLIFYPYNPDVFGLVSGLFPPGPPTPGFGQWQGTVEKALTKEPTLPDQATVQSALTSEDVQELCGFASPKHARPIRYLALMRLWELGEKDTLLEAGRAFCASPAGAAAAPFLAWAAWRSGDADLAQNLLNAGHENFLSLNLRAEMALKAGDADLAGKIFRESLAFEPGQPFLIFRLCELSQPLQTSDPPDGQRVHIFLYTYNKLQSVLETLKSLLHTHIGQARITLLNNGSTAFSPEDLDQGVKSVAKGRPVKVIHLPVNIGAPAARNWLWHLPEEPKAEYAAFLDDDVLLPENWLACYLQDMEDFPGTVVVGPKGVNPTPLPTVQYAYRYFQETGQNKIRLTANAPLVMDLGQYDIRRPCLSVMGCCHLLNRVRCEKLNVPDFDIGFAPSQVDDIEHDLQIWKAGGRVLFDGRVAVVHRQTASIVKGVDRAEHFRILANHKRMEMKFSRTELQAMDKAVREADEAWWRHCLDEVRETLPLAARDFYDAAFTPWS